MAKHCARSAVTVHWLCVWAEDLSPQRSTPASWLRTAAASCTQSTAASPRGAESAAPKSPARGATADCVFHDLLEGVARGAAVGHHHVLHHEDGNDVVRGIHPAVGGKSAAVAAAAGGHGGAHDVAGKVHLPAEAIVELLAASLMRMGHFLHRVWLEDAHAVQFAAVGDHRIEAAHVSSRGE